MRALAALLLLPLAACEVDTREAERVLARSEFTEVLVHRVWWVETNCDWSEQYVLGFTGVRNGKRYAGTLCATSSDPSDARVLGRVVGPAPRWDAFGARH